MSCTPSQTQEEEAYRCCCCNNREYKVISAELNYFSNELRLQRCLEEEATNGWRLIEKLDDSRIRLVRHPVEQESKTGTVSPYRCHIGVSTFTLVAITSLIVFLVLFFPLLSTIFHLHH